MQPLSSNYSFGGRAQARERFTPKSRLLGCAGHQTFCYGSCHVPPDEAIPKELTTNNGRVTQSVGESQSGRHTSDAAISKMLTKNGGRVLQGLGESQSNRYVIEEDTMVASGYRRLTPRSVTLPPQRWYNMIHIPGVTRRTSPYSNAVYTTKYTFLTFIPKNLWEQCHRWANLFFVFVIALNFVPAIEAITPEIAPIPVAFVLLVTAVKDAFEDYRRYKSDREVNGKLCRVYDWEMGEFVERQWQSVRVGDFVELSSDEVIPADILLLHSSDPHGVCFIETANIDGETNLKQRQVAPGSVKRRNEQAPAAHFNPRDFSGEVCCEEPHNRINEFNGFVVQPDVYTHSVQPGRRRAGVNRSNLLLRGCIVRNTTSVAGIVVYAGHETKAMLNNSGPRAKRSKLERTINAEIVSQVAILVVLCLIGAIANGIWTAQNLDRNIIFFPFSSETVLPALEGFIRFWTFVILYQVIIPLSLYVSIEIVKFIQVYFINGDKDMYYEPTDRPFQCRALNISEDLGQIQFVFSDKTGTLTENKMAFKCCSIGGKNYPHTLAAEFAKHGTTSVSLATHTLSASDEPDYPNPPEQPIQLDPGLVTDLRVPSLTERFIEDFFIVMAICNTVVVSENVHHESERTCCQRDGGGEREEGGGEGGGGEGGGGGGGGEGGEGGGRRGEGRGLNTEAIAYEAESPDEAALVEAARAYGYTLVSRSPSHCTILTPRNQQITFEVLHVLEFDSNRKCMSVVVRRKGDPQVILYSKGADSVIYRNLAHRSGLHPEKVSGAEVDERVPSLAELTQMYLNMYARLGLRTLCLAKRVLSEEEYGRWSEERHAAEVALENRDTLLFQSACSVEKNLELLGATGIEDRLQERVPEAIEGLRAAGIKIWVLTGDKRETAINIAYSSHLIDDDMDVIIIKVSSQEECQRALEARQREFEEQENTNIVEQASTNGSIDSILSRLTLLRPMCRADLDSYRAPPKALVIDGTSLQFALHPDVKKLFLNIASRCRSVICCRAAPLQKAAVVELVKVNLRQMTLAVGDGANDVSMIQMADVGVGVAGKEGMQAVMASDFAMARFNFLENLLLVHGHWCYSRLARMMLYFFYKNVAYAVLIFWFQLFNAFSGSNPIDTVNLLIFNLVYTSLPILAVAIIDQDLPKEMLLADKHYYKQGRCSEVYTRFKFWLTMIDAFYESAVVFFMAFVFYYPATDVGVTEFGFVINISMVVVVSLHLAIETLHWTIVNHVLLWGSVVFAFVFNYIYTAIYNILLPDTEIFWVMQRASIRAEFWFLLLLTPMVALLPRLIAKVIMQEAFPSPVLKARATENLTGRSRAVKTAIEEESGEDASAQNHSHPL